MFIVADVSWMRVTYILFQEGSLPHTTIESWQESNFGPESIATEVDERGNVITYHACIVLFLMPQTTSFAVFFCNALAYFSCFDYLEVANGDIQITASWEMRKRHLFRSNQRNFCSSAIIYPSTSSVVICHLHF